MEDNLIEIENKDDIEEIGKYGTTYRRSKGIFVATTIGVNNTEKTFVYYYD